jgi:hypothetical protein
MPTIHFTGRVLPEHLEMTWQELPKLVIAEPARDDLPTGMSMELVIRIEKGGIEIACEANPFDQPWHLSWVHNRILSHTRAFVDLYSFATGCVFAVILDTYTDPDGRSTNLRTADDSLARLCTFSQTDPSSAHSINFARVLDLLITETETFLAMRDLINGLTYANSTAVDCARAVEGLRRIMAGDDDRKRGWAIMQDTLHITQRYLSFITDISALPRHGARPYIPHQTIHEILERSWNIMNRFLEFRRRGSLPISEFPILDG